ncbi:24903_t:CDS:2 [Dentiscutata erythropus]|uniref:24903_t:CDS:1 n=1 Tax=Dentiscutata erythropus TaxID=1348616 RepID=A0A9N9E317_9GLOM|nr:24903_t:CDS:2 [Dentiscutata erythropus]
MSNDIEILNACGICKNLDQDDNINDPLKNKRYKETLHDLNREFMKHYMLILSQSKKFDPEHVNLMSELLEKQKTATLISTRANIFNDSNRDKKSLEYYNNALKLAPYDVDILKGCGYLNLELRNYKEALENFNKALEIMPNNKKLFELYAIAYRKRLMMMRR